MADSDSLGDRCLEDHSNCSSPSKNKIWKNDEHSSVEIGLENDKCMSGSYSEIVDGPWESQLENDDTSDNPKNKDVELLTPICEDFNPSQSFMIEDRINAFMRLNVAGECDQDLQLKIHSEKSKDEESNDPNLFSFASQEWLDKMSSNISSIKKTTGSSSSSMNGCHNLLRSTLQPTVPLIEPEIIHQIEAHARNIATSMDTLIENLTGTLHTISSLTVDCVETYCVAVCKTCDAVDSNIKSMYQLMAKCEELSKSMDPMYKLHNHIKEIRRLLDLFENIVYTSAS